MSNYAIGDVVKAVVLVTESGCECGDVEAKFPDPHYIHATPGDLGEVAYIDEEGYPTVRFFRTGTATIIDPGDLKLHYSTKKIAEAIVQVFSEPWDKETWKRFKPILEALDPEPHNQMVRRMMPGEDDARYQPETCPACQYAMLAGHPNDKIEDRACLNPTCVRHKKVTHEQAQTPQ